MNCQIGVVRSSTEEEVKSKKFNIYIGMSLGNKFFTKENLREYLNWALKYTKERVCFLVADTLHSVNYEIRNDYKPKRAKEVCLRKGDEIIKILKELISELSLNEKKKIDIVRWDDLTLEKDYNLYLEVLQKKYKEDASFRTFILDIIKEYLSDSQRNFNNEKINKLADYILEEIYSLLNGFRFNKTNYNCYIYPKDSKLNIFIEKILNKELFCELYDLLDIKGNVFVELKVNS